MKTYRIRFETVYPGRLKNYMNADPMVYSNTSQIISNSRVPDEDWYEVVKETDNPWDQFWVLRKWSSEDAHFVRNIRLEKLVTAPEWAELNDEDIVRLTADGL
jgi:hypothetical protein